jgi:hypothetical protein
MGKVVLPYYITTHSLPWIVLEYWVCWVFGFLGFGLVILIGVVVEWC